MNQKQIEGIKPLKSLKWYTIAPNLRLSVTPAGVKRFVVRYTVTGKRLDRTLGVFGPGEHELSLKDAIAQTAVIVSGAAENTDVVTAQRAQKAAENGNRVADAFEIFFEEKIQEKKGKRGRIDGGAELRRQYEKYWGAHFGNHPLQAVTATAVIRYLKGVAATGKNKPKNRTAVVLFVDIKQFMLWCSERQPWRAMIAGTDFFSVEKTDVVLGNYDPVRDNERDRVLSDAEVVALYAALSTSTIPRYAQHAISIMLGSGCRVGELSQAKWANIDLDGGFWYLPADDTKTKVDMRITLSSFTQRAFEALKAIAGDSEFVFPRSPNVLNAVDRPIDKQTIGKHIANRQTSAAVNARRRRTEDFDGLMLEGGKWTAHDLRRTMGRIMRSGCGVAKDVTHMCMNHAQENAMDRIYLPERQTPQMHTAWTVAGLYLDELLKTGKSPDEKFLLKMRTRTLQLVA